MWGVGSGACRVRVGSSGHALCPPLLRARRVLGNRRCANGMWSTVSPKAPESGHDGLVARESDGRPWRTWL